MTMGHQLLDRDFTEIDLLGHDRIYDIHKLYRTFWFLAIK
jgi:hypothetical protein